MMTMSLTKEQAIVFLLDYQGLAGYDLWSGKQGMIEYVKQAGCVQFDPLNVVGHNHDLVFQSRIQGYRVSMLQELLYQSREFVDGWDKNMSIYHVEDWPFFHRLRQTARVRLERRPELNAWVQPVLDRLEREGPMTSGDLGYNEIVNWSWAPTRLSRAVLESLFFSGELMIHHKQGTRRVYDLASRMLPRPILHAPDPNPDPESYWDWYVARRIGAIGLVWNMSTDAWVGISGINQAIRTQAMRRLLDRHELIQVSVDGIKNSLYVRAAEQERLERALEGGLPYRRAYILAPLDNILWDRRLITELFGFHYRWEVYKPVAERMFGYYVLPVLYGERFVARFESAVDRKSGEWVIKKWWWEPNIARNHELIEELRRCFLKFMNSLEIVQLRVAEEACEEDGLVWLSSLAGVSAEPDGHSL